MDEAEARRIMSGGLGRAELEFVTSICAPFYWVVDGDGGSRSVRNGSIFFLDTGVRAFAVTADHVLSGLESDIRSSKVVSVQIGHDLEIGPTLASRVIDRCAKIDIATIDITRREVARLGKTVLSGLQSSWPPKPPMLGRGIYFSGFAGSQTKWMSASEISFGAVPGSGVADRVSEKDVTTLFNREAWLDVMGTGFPPESFDFGGISGGPMLTVIERSGLRSWSLAGVIYEGPNPSTLDGESIQGFEIIKARPAHFIKPHGDLDRLRWPY